MPKAGVYKVATDDHPRLREKQCPRCGKTKPLSEFYAGYRNPQNARDYSRGGLGDDPRLNQSSYCKPCTLSYRKEWQVKNRSKYLATHRRSKIRGYGISPETYDQMLLAQGRRCAVCGVETPGGKGKHFCIDHDHASGAVRGLLCNHCNSGIGHFKDDPALLALAIAYLQGGPKNV